jgi:hypothetical protein
MQTTIIKVSNILNGLLWFMILHDRLENVIYDNGTHIDLNMHNNVSIDQVLSCIHFIYINISFLIDGKEEWTPLLAYTYTTKIWVLCKSMQKPQL